MRFKCTWYYRRNVLYDDEYEAQNLRVFILQGKTKDRVSTGLRHGTVYTQKAAVKKSTVRGFAFSGQSRFGRVFDDSILRQESRTAYPVPRSRILLQRWPAAARSFALLIASYQLLNATYYSSAVRPCISKLPNVEYHLVRRSRQATVRILQYVQRMSIGCIHNVSFSVPFEISPLRRLQSRS